MKNNKTMKRYLLLIAGLLTLSTIAAAQEEEKKLISPDGTYMFEKRDDVELFLDVYEPSEGSETSIEGKAKPTILFMFGGGFIQGQRDDSSYHKWFKMLTDNGFKVISIDYRLGLKGSKRRC